MTGWWLVSYVVLWLLVATSVVILLVVLRQLGLIYMRAKAGGVFLDEGPAVGSRVTRFGEPELLSGEDVYFPAGDGSPSLLIIASPHCAICKDVVGGLGPATTGRNLHTVVLSEGSAEENSELAELVVNRAPLMANLQRQRMLGIQSIPYAIVTSPEGVVLAKGPANSVDELEDIIERGAQPATGLQQATISVVEEEQWTAS
jgi:methylamine dehydrogenase accessory protein MauD